MKFVFQSKILIFGDLIMALSDFEQKFLLFQRLPVTSNGSLQLTIGSSNVAFEVTMW